MMRNASAMREVYPTCQPTERMKSVCNPLEKSDTIKPMREKSRLGNIMNIEFSNAEYRVLLDAIEIADWILHAHTMDELEGRDHFRALFQKIFSKAKEANCEDLIEQVSGGK